MRKLAVFGLATSLLVLGNAVMDASRLADASTQAVEPKAAVDAFFSAHSRGDIASLEAMYAASATISLAGRGPSGPAITTMPVKQYLGWFQGQFASRAAMRFVVGQLAVHGEGNLAAAWIPLEIHETMKDGSQLLVRAVASLHLIRDDRGWRVTAHAFQATAGK